MTNEPRRNLSHREELEVGPVQTTLKSGIQLVVVELNWPLNAHWADETIQILTAVADLGAKQIVVNMENVSFIDSHGLAALVNSREFFGKDTKRFYLAGLQAQTKLFLRLTQFDQVFEIFDHVGDAPGCA
jgi:anti-anti-sigma factor